MPMIVLPTKDQITIGRSLLNWTKKRLGEEAEVGLATIKRLETNEDGIISARVGTVVRVKETLEKNGIEFLLDGMVRRRP